MDCRKEKNLIIIKHPTSGKDYSIDINTGTVVGVSGKPVKELPPYMKEANINENDPIQSLVYKFIMMVFFCKEHDQSKDFLIAYMQLCDRLVALGLKPVGTREFYHNRDDYNKVVFNAETVAFFREVCNGAVDLGEYRSRTYYTLLTKYNLPGNMSRQIRQFSGNINEDMEYLEYCLSKLSFGYFTEIDSIYAMFQDYYNLCNRMNIKWEKSKSFLETYARMKKEYKAFQAKEINEKLARFNHAKYAFEDETYIVIVPTTSEQFKDEADQQSNCVFRMYMERVADGRTNIVFIRRKENITKSFLTCEIENNRISQALREGNNRLDRNDPAHEFLEKYRNYLRTL